MPRTLLIAFLSTLSATTQIADAATKAERLVGSWRLISAEGHSADGQACDV